MQVLVEIPDEFAADLLPPGQDAARLLLEESVASAYRAHRVSMEQVRRILGFATRMDVDGFLLRHEVYDYTLEDLDADMAVLERLRTKTRALER